MGHYASEMGYDRDDEDRRRKKSYEASLGALSRFCREANTQGISHEVESIRKFYQSKLYELRHIDIDSDSV